jgi:hypothetical protein
MAEGDSAAWDEETDGGSLAGPRAEPEFPAAGSRALLHVGDAVTPCGTTDIEALAIVLHFHGKGSPAPRQPDRDRGGSRVPPDIVEGFLEDEKDIALGFQREAGAGIESVDLHGPLHA